MQFTGIGLNEYTGITAAHRVQSVPPTTTRKLINGGGGGGGEKTGTVLRKKKKRGEKGRGVFANFFF